MDYINQYKLVCKCFTCNKIGHLTKNCELKSKHCPTICGGAYSVAYKGCPSYKSAMIKSIYIQQISPTHRQWVVELQKRH